MKSSEQVLPELRTERTANTAWTELVRRLIFHGDSKAKPRQIKTREIVGCQSSFAMRWPVVTEPRRKLGLRFLAAEAAWILSGDNRVSTITPFSKIIHTFSDDGVRFNGAYGPRVIDQLGYVVDSIAQDQDTRQAVMTIWRPNPRPSKDIPCTVAVQWLVRDGVIHCVDTMRSSDAWLGVPYDWFNFSMLTLYIALMLRELHGISLQLGTMFFNAGSQHLYETNYSVAFNTVITRPDFEDLSAAPPALTTDMFEDFEDLLPHLWALANKDKHGLRSDFLAHFVKD